MRGFAIAIAVVLSLSTEGCRRYQRVTARANACAVGQPRECQCSTGASGMQDCRLDGNGFDECDCAASVTLVAPLQVVAGTPLSDVFMELRDSMGRVLSESTAGVATLSLVNAGAVSIKGTPTASVSAGHAVFSAARLETAGMYSLQVAYDGELGLASATASLEVAAAPFGALAVVVEPPALYEQATTIVPSVVVEARDSFGNPTPITGVVSASVIGNPSSVVGPFHDATFVGTRAFFSRLSVFSSVEAVVQFEFKQGTRTATSRSVSFVRPDVEWPRFTIGQPVFTTVPFGHLDERTGLYWTDPDTQGTFATAASVCSAVAPATIDNRAYNWRVPSLVELSTLIDFTKPVASFTSYPTGLRTQKYWTRSAAGASNGYVVGFDNARTAIDPVATNHYVACVLETTPPRSVSASGAPAGLYINEADGSLAKIDTKTSLMWRRENTPCASCTFSQATTACDGETSGGYADWRLPTARELASIVDVRVTSAGARLDPNVFVSALATEYWSSTADPLTAANALTVDFATGAMQTRDKTVAGTTAVRCVR